MQKRTINNIKVLDNLTVLIKASCKKFCGISKIGDGVICTGDFFYRTTLCCTGCKYLKNSGCSVKSISCALWHCKIRELNPNTKFRKIVYIIHKYDLIPNHFLSVRISNKDYAISFGKLDLQTKIEGILNTNIINETKINQRYIKQILQAIK